MFITKFAHVSIRTAGLLFWKWLLSQLSRSILILLENLSHSRGSCPWWVQCDQFVRFLKLHGDKITKKSKKNDWQFLGNVDKPHCYVKNAVATFWKTFGNNGLLFTPTSGHTAGDFHSLMKNPVTPKPLTQKFCNFHLGSRLRLSC